MTELERVKKEIKELQAKLKFLQSIEDTKTQEVREAFKTAYGVYPAGDFSAGDWDVIAWDAFRKGYETAQSAKDVEIKEQPKPQTLYEILCDYEYRHSCDDICDIVNDWLPVEPDEIGVSYGEGWSDCLNYLRGKLK